MALRFIQRWPTNAGHGIALSSSRMAASTFTPSPRLVYKDRWTREPLALSSALLLRLLVPAYHLLHLTGRFPVIHGNDDKRIPKKPTDGLHL